MSEPDGTVMLPSGDTLPFAPEDAVTIWYCTAWVSCTNFTKYCLPDAGTLSMRRVPFRSWSVISVPASEVPSYRCVS